MTPLEKKRCVLRGSRTCRYTAWVPRGLERVRATPGGQCLRGAWARRYGLCGAPAYAGLRRTRRGRATRARVEPWWRVGATARSALGWHRPSVGVPRDVGCRIGKRVANLFSVLPFKRGDVHNYPCGLWRGAACRAAGAGALSSLPRSPRPTASRAGKALTPFRGWTTNNSNRTKSKMELLISGGHRGRPQRRAGF